jgi:hypothetical protein
VQLSEMTEEEAILSRADLIQLEISPLCEIIEIFYSMKIFMSREKKKVLLCSNCMRHL